MVSSEVIETEGETSRDSVSSDKQSTLPKIALSDFKVEAGNLFRRHKTTNRKLYNDEFSKYEKQGFYDVLFLNDSGTIAEASRHNLFIEKNGILYTTPIADGALPGVMRSYLLADSDREIIEKTLTLEDLMSADKVYLSNSVRGLIEVFFDN